MLVRFCRPNVGATRSKCLSVGVQSSVGIPHNISSLTHADNREFRDKHDIAHSRPNSWLGLLSWFAVQSRTCPCWIPLSDPSLEHLGSGAHSICHTHDPVDLRAGVFLDVLPVLSLRPRAFYQTLSHKIICNRLFIHPSHHVGTVLSSWLAIGQYSGWRIQFSSISFWVPRTFSCFWAATSERWQSKRLRSTWFLRSELSSPTAVVAVLYKRALCDINALQLWYQERHAKL